MTSLCFQGGAGTVTGSRFHLEVDGRTLLVDCGLFQGEKALRLRNWEPPCFDPRRLDAVVLTHAHVDHSGWLPRLARLGYGGPVACTPATADLAAVLLRDAAKIQVEDAEYANRKGFSRHRPALPLFDDRDAEAAIALLSPRPYGAEFEPIRGFARVKCRLRSVGHIVGSAMVEIEIGGPSPLRLLFSGDVGRYGAPLVRDPEPPPECDMLVVESTYGDRLHPPQGPAATLCSLLARAQRERGVVLIPAFAVGRAQQIVLLLRRAMERGEAPEMAIHVDSPMAVDATGIYLRHPEESGLERLDLEAGDRTIFGRGVYLHRSREESIRLNALEGPRVIVSSSGMLAGGRVLHHLRRLLPEPRHVIVLAGFQPAGTRGRSLLEGARHLRMHGQDVPVRAHVEQVPGLSAHADQAELLRWLRGMPAPPRRTYVVHGEPGASAAFAARLRAELGHDCRVPAHLDRVELNGTGR